MPEEASAEGSEEGVVMAAEAIGVVVPAAAVDTLATCLASRLADGIYLMQQRVPKVWAERVSSCYPDIILSWDWRLRRKSHRTIHGRTGMAGNGSVSRNTLREDREAEARC